MSKQPKFNPYVNNGGTVAAVAVGDRCVVAGDTRISVGFNILSREYSKITQLTSKVVIATSGMVADAQALHRLMQARVTMYTHKNGAEPSLSALARLLCVTLYGRRFFPFYTFNLLAGIDENGEPGVYGYDAIGSHDKMNYGARGSGDQLLFPVLDNQFTGRNQTTPVALENGQFKGDPVELLKDLLTSAAERDINTGDSAEVWEITRNGINKSSIPLRQDQAIIRSQ